MAIKRVISLCFPFSERRASMGRKNGISNFSLFLSERQKRGKTILVSFHSMAFFSTAMEKMKFGSISGQFIVERCLKVFILPICFGLFSPSSTARKRRVLTFRLFTVAVKHSESHNRNSS